MRKLAPFSFRPLFFSGLLLLAACGENLDNTASGYTSVAMTCNPVRYSLIDSSTAGSSNTDASKTDSSTDPLREQQWHLTNADSTIKQGINLPESLWGSITGQGVNIAIVDTSIDYNHPDLQENLDLQNSCQFGNTPTGGHGTAVAGLIGAVKDNGQGITGVAPGSTILGFNTLDLPDEQITTATWATSLSATNSRNAAIDVFNLSFGFQPKSTPVDFDVNLNGITQEGVELGRGGLGALYFKAAGNYFIDTACDVSDSDYYMTDLPCQSATLDPDNNIAYMMVVAALSADGARAHYSSSGSSVLLTAPGGGNGNNDSNVSSTSRNSIGSVGLVTTKDIDLAVPSAEPKLTDIPRYKGYTRNFTGTSAATPIATGVAALILQANPNLGWRDVRDILIRTADIVDASIRTVNIGSLIVEPAWQTNGAGLSYHNWYGFGRINANAAVNRAIDHINLPSQVIKTVSFSATSGSIPNDMAQPFRRYFSAPTGMSTVESVQLKLNISHPYPADLMIQLTSPSGTDSVMLTPRNALSGEIEGYEFTLLSQAFYGENSAGDWILTVYDTDNDEYAAGAVHDWSVTFYGY